jgi:hypothetical protein
LIRNTKERRDVINRWGFRLDLPALGGAFGLSKGFAEERRRRRIILFPARPDDAVMDTSEAWAVKLRDQCNIGDVRGWKDYDRYKTSFQRMLHDLKLATAASK